MLFAVIRLLRWLMPEPIHPADAMSLSALWELRPVEQDTFEMARPFYSGSRLLGSGVLAATVLAASRTVRIVISDPAEAARNAALSAILRVIPRLT